ncbi:hypothetical protein [Streptomyces sp. NPDC047981]|uniref:hypothetical protein n=1 Tax=Streptomyces sp. NPDC047981 TaxID=3154610 RepID=UPI00344607A3
MELTPEQLVAEFQDAVMELYFARKRIGLLEAENAALRERLARSDQPPHPAGSSGTSGGTSSA